ncbi:4-diphosphocytidyl-2-C-methyl-D-erythritol kinase [Ereboglobus sp. PH5-10]|uniref:4-(cytidine 5'-diphospho)-2-C-methyl-D-erythritol kinase n=1 Tax=Ereboglobus sp. PH5-10 TaxID=2940629 RepID=UPI0031B80FE1|nr:4-diphosphocytidyl-2-C-methyl-D-erythritol kinase [Ereboglobus sp. PH5-10]
MRTCVQRMIVCFAKINMHEGQQCCKVRGVLCLNGRDVHTVSIFSPAKINLFLAITGRRADGFHDLLSVVAPVSFGDEIRIEFMGEGAPFELTCADAAVPVDATNLVLRAAEAFRNASGWGRGARFSLHKRIPTGAGLGGGSSNAAMVLRALNDAAGRPLGRAQLVALAGGLGSDCALFLHGGPVVMRGRGERAEPLSGGAARRLAGRRVLIFKPDVSINTAWSYRRMAARAPESYLAEKNAEARLAAWLENTTAGAEGLLFNNMEPVAFEKFVALPVLLARLRGRFGVAAGMSGSGSACFALLRDDATADAVREMMECARAALGRGAFVAEARIAC